MSGRILPVVGSTEAWGSRQVSATVHCLLAPNASAWTLDGTNTWLVREPRGPAAIVIDPGPSHSEHRDAIEALTKRLDVRIRAIVLTHGHADHSESARSLGQRWRVPVKAVDPGLRLGSEGLAPDATVDLGESALRVVATPGHTQDSVCLLLEHERFVLTGDTVLGRGTAVVMWPDGDLGAYFDSLDRLAQVVVDHDVRALLPGHGPMLRDPAEALDAYRTHRRQRLAQVADIVRSGVDDPAEVVRLAYEDLAADLRGAAEMSVRAQLSYLSRLRQGLSVTNP